MVEHLHQRFNRLYKKRKKSVTKLTINKIAFILQVSRQYVVYWKNGSRRIPEEFIDGLCRILGVTVEEFLTDTIQISGKKEVVNFSNTPIKNIKELKKYPGLSLAEVETVLQYKKENQVG